MNEENDEQDLHDWKLTNREKEDVNRLSEDLADALALPENVDRERIEGEIKSALRNWVREQRYYIRSRRDITD